MMFLIGCIGAVGCVSIIFVLFIRPRNLEEKAVAMSILLMCLAFFAGYGVANNFVKTKAIENNAAHYCIDKSFEIEFVWGPSDNTAVVESCK